jgi:hypothetical protein
MRPNTLPSSISDRVLADGISLVGSSESLAARLPEALSAYVGPGFAVHAGQIVRTAGQEVLNFPAVVHTAASSPRTFQPEEVACVIEAVETLDLTSLATAYDKIVAAKAIPKPPLPKSSVVRTDRTLGVIFAKSSAVALDVLADEMDRLNQQNLSSNWPDMIAVLGVGTLNYVVQFPGEGVLGDYMPPAADTTGERRPAMYIVMALKPAGVFTFNKALAYLVGHLGIFTPSADLPKFPEILVEVTQNSIILAGYQLNKDNNLVPVPPEFRNDRYIPPWPYRIEGPDGKPLALLQYLQWKDGAVLMLKSLMPEGAIPLEGLMVFLGQAAIQTGYIVRRPPSTQLSNVLPINQQDFNILLQRIQKQSNMRVVLESPGWVFQKFADEGSRSPFMTRLFIGVTRLRDQVYHDKSAVDSFDNAYNFALTTMLDVRTLATEIVGLIQIHSSSVSGGQIAKVVAGNNIRIDESIDRDLRTKVESFLVAAARVLKKGLQEFSVFLGTDIGFLFKKESTFLNGIANLQTSDPLLADYLLSVRPWSEALQLTRNSIEHAAWTPPKMSYRQMGQKVEAVEPQLVQSPVSQYVVFITDRLSCFIEEFSVHCLLQKLPREITVTEVQIAKRVADLPERFHITPSIGGLPAWVLKYHSEIFDQV